VWHAVQRAVAGGARLFEEKSLLVQVALAGFVVIRRLASW
jgi:hypothetical protein